MNHFTNKDGYDGIRSQSTWRFRAEQPPGGHERGAYFTTLRADEPKLAARLGIPRSKLAYVFSFNGDEGLRPMRGDRGRYVLYSPEDYEVVRERQVACTETGLV